MRLADGHDERTRGSGLRDLVKRLEAVNTEIDEYCATTLRLERSRWARDVEHDPWLGADIGDVSIAESLDVWTEESS